ncbi:MAG TPA: glycosyltransferase family 4 protein [Gaiellaceae bacterium]|nr:glycosyltransferase family 4 protein [Gaiellaceae bacterium]
MRRPKVLFVGRTRYRLPLSSSLARKFDALGDELDLHVLASAAERTSATDPVFTLVRPLRVRGLDGVAFWLALPWRVTQLLRELRPEAVVCQTPYDAAATLLARRLSHVPARVVVEVHGDWRTSTRLYGSPARRLVSRFADGLAALALRRADAVRTVSPFTAGLVRALGVEPADDFPAYMDLEPFVREPQPLPHAPLVLFVGVLEAYKNVDGLADAWRRAAPRVPAATLHVVGKGTRTDVADALVRLGARWDPELSPAEVARALDEAWVLVLPSRSEGMGRVLVEAFCRGRGVVGTRAGSIPDLVQDGVSGLLVPPDDAGALADALVRVLSDRSLAERLGEGARASAAPWLQSPEEYARRVRELVVA